MWIRWAERRAVTLAFQPFLRFWGRVSPGMSSNLALFQPFLRFWAMDKCKRGEECADVVFQPFLRFWGLCSWFLRVFKFFFGFL